MKKVISQTAQNLWRQAILGDPGADSGGRGWRQAYM